MKKIYLYIFLSTILISCEKDEIISQKESSQPLQELPYVENIEYQNLPEDFFNFLQEKKFSKNQEYQNFSFGKVRKDMPAVKIVNKAGKISYTFVLENQEDSILSSSSTVYFDNLVVYKDDNRADLVHILRYIPTSEWYKNSKDFKEYSGSVIIYLPTGKKLSELQVVNGNRDQANQKNFNKVSCNLKLESQTELCTQLHEDDGTPIGELKCTTTYHYTWECSTGGSEGGSETGTSGPDHEEVPLGGGSTAPTLPEEEKEIIDEKIVNEIQNPCGALIFGQLNLLSTSYDLTVTVNDPEVGSLKFSQAILNMFNEATNSDYIVKEKTMINPENTASTSPSPTYNSVTGRFEITTTFNSLYLATASRLSIARSMIHESIHGYLVYQQRLNANRDVYELVNNYATSNGFSTADLNTIHHEFMAQFVNSIAYNLRLWDRNHGTGGNLGWQYYHDMAWGGLANYRDPNDNTKILFYNEFQNYIRNQDDPSTAKNEGLSVEQRILNTIENESKNNSNAKGDDCP